MKVYYPGPDIKTFHPELGLMITGKAFELNKEQAEKYVSSGLLKKVEKKKELKD